MMHSVPKVVFSSLLLLLSATPGALAQSESQDPNAWVSIDENNQATTITPVSTTIDGTPTVIDAPPAEATNTVVTRTSNGEVRTTTNTAVIATATNSNGAGSFTVCKNKDGELAPFCEVAGGQPLIIGNTYYITWDPRFYGPNTTVEITGNYINETTQQVDTQAFSSGQREAQWGWWAFTASSDVLKDRSNVTISLLITGIELDSDNPKINDGPRIVVKQPEIYHPPQPQLSKRGLMIGIPVSIGAIFFITIGLCLWNRKTREIGIKNVMGRGKRGYGISKSRLQRLGRTSKAGIRGQDIPLVDRKGESVYIDNPYNVGTSRSRTPGGGAKLSEDLGSLAAENPRDSFRFELGQGAGRNAFREELARQNRDKLA